jgi:hypothetical protein
MNFFMTWCGLDCMEMGQQRCVKPQYKPQPPAITLHRAIPRTPLTSLCAIFFFRFHDRKKKLNLWRHEKIESVTMELTAILKEAFTSCFQDLQKRWQQCIDCGGDYFEGDRNH